MPFAELQGQCVGLRKDSSQCMLLRVFEQGLAYVGTDYLAHALWDKYISFELSQSATAKVAQLYERIFACPIRELDRFYSRSPNTSASCPVSCVVRLGPIKVQAIS